MQTQVTGLRARCLDSHTISCIGSRLSQALGSFLAFWLALHKGFNPLGFCGFTLGPRLSFLPVNSFLIGSISSHRGPGHQCRNLPLPQVPLLDSRPRCSHLHLAGERGLVGCPVLPFQNWTGIFGSKPAPPPTWQPQYSIKVSRASWLLSLPLHFSPLPAHVQPLLLTLTFQDLSHPSSSTHLYQQHSPETLNWGQFCLSADIHLEGSHLGRKDATDIQLVETRATSKQPTVPRAALNSKDDAAQNITSTEAVQSSQHHLLPELFHIPPPLSPYPPGSLQPTLHSLLPEESFKKTNVVPCLNVHRWLPNSFTSGKFKLDVARRCSVFLYLTSSILFLYLSFLLLPIRWQGSFPFQSSLAYMLLTFPSHLCSNVILTQNLPWSPQLCILPTLALIFLIAFPTTLCISSSVYLFVFWLLQTELSSIIVEMSVFSFKQIFLSTIFKNNLFGCPRF